MSCIFSRDSRIANVCLSISLKNPSASIGLQAIWPLSLLTIRPINHQAYQSSSLSTKEPIYYQAYQSLSLSNIEPIFYWAYQPTGLLSQLLSLSACFCFISFSKSMKNPEYKCAKSSNGVEAGLEMFKVNSDKNH